MTQLLVIGEERERNEDLRNHLEAEGYEVTIADTVEEGLRAMDASPPDLVLAAEPALLPAIRHRTTVIPVMILTSIQSEDMLRAFAPGADDWVVMPVSMPVLQARVLALLQRTRPPESRGPSWVRIGDLDIHPGERRVRRGGSAVNLTSKEFDLLLTLLRHRDRAVSPVELIDAVWRAPAVTTRTVDKHVNSLRRKLCRNTRRSLIIVTEPRKAGYRLFIDAAGTGINRPRQSEA
jgi:DNA-binding response OmpR family regulator